MNLEQFQFDFGYAGQNSQHINACLKHGVHALVGPNGSGKTCLLLSLSGSIPHRCRETPVSLPSNNAIGFIPLQSAFGDYSTVSEFFDIFLSHHKNNLDQETVEHHTRHWDVAHLMARRPQDVSSGEQQRLFLCRFFLIPRTLYLCDEPLNMLDFKYQKKFFEMCQLKAKQRAVIIYSTHQPVLHLETHESVIVLDGHGSFEQISRGEGFISQCQRALNKVFSVPVHASGTTLTLGY